MQDKYTYIGAICPIATYGLPIFWKSKNGRLLNTLTMTQNKCLHMIMGAFQMTNITAMEIEVSIPPIELWMEYRLKMEALWVNHLAKDHPIVSRVYPEQRNHTLPSHPPPLPLYDVTKRYRMNPKLKLMTCITQVSKRIIEETEHIIPHAEPPWRPSEIDFNDRVRIFTPKNTPGKSLKEDWMNDHIELTMEEEDSHKTLFIYSDGSLLEKKGRRYSGFGVIGYNQGRKVFERREALGEHTKVFDAEMAGLHAASTKARWFIENKPTNRRPVKIVFYVDNTGAIHRIFKGSPGSSTSPLKRLQMGDLQPTKLKQGGKSGHHLVPWAPGHHQQ